MLRKAADFLTPWLPESHGGSGRVGVGLLVPLLPHPVFVVHLLPHVHGTIYPVA